MERDTYFDNAKAILIILVVVGHILELFIAENNTARSLYVLIYTFHMPVFVFIAGYFSKRLNNLARKEIKYLLVFVTASLVYWPISNIPLLYMFVFPYYLLWFLVSLVYWTVMLQFFVKIKHPILVSFLIAILAGYIDLIGPLLSLSRSVTFFPFFLLGYYANKDQLKTITPKVAIIVFMAVFGAAVLLNNAIDYGWLFGQSPYSRFGWDQWYAGVFRVICYAINLLVGLCFLSLIPHLKSSYTWLGSKTLIVYLGHGFIITALRYFY